MLAYNDSIINATSYDDMQELMLSSDILISDYSGCVFEFMLTNRPVFLYMQDYEQYKKERDFYCDMLSLPFPWAKDINKLIYEVKKFDNRSYVSKIKDFIGHTGSFEDGNASVRVVDKICGIIHSVL